MDLRQYVHVLRTRWLLVASIVLVCTGAAAALAWTRTEMYAASTRLFVSTASAAAAPSETYQGGLFSQQRVLSYARIVSSPPVVRAVIRDLGLPDSIQRVQREIRASVPTDSVLIDITVTDPSPSRAAAIANALGRQFPRFVSALESPQAGRNSPVTVSVTSPARQPNRPVSPRKAPYLALGALLGLVLAIETAVLRNAFDSRVRGEWDAAAILDAPVLGRILEHRAANKRPLVMIDEPSSGQAEAYRQLRTNLSPLGTELGSRSMVVSSAVASEGKTLVAANLGVVFAQAGTRVVVVDADLRSPKLARVFGLDASEGLTNLLVNGGTVERALHHYDALPLHVLPSGPRPPNPSELLGSKRFAKVLIMLTQRFDIVILDAPALVPVTDAAILAQLATSIILVTRPASTRTNQLKVAAQSLRAVDTQALGVVLNRLRGGNGRSRR